MIKYDLKIGKLRENYDKNKINLLFLRKKGIILTGVIFFTQWRANTDSLFSQSEGTVRYASRNEIWKRNITG